MTTNPGFADRARKRTTASYSAGETMPVAKDSAAYPTDAAALFDECGHAVG
jgi:hypothetical protein